jgi:hypothetical protein
MDQLAVDDVQPMLVVLGLDASGKPRASRFTPADSELAVIAARLMDLRAVNVVDEQLRQTAAELPLGKIYATGRGLVPLVKQGLYDKLAVLIGTESEVKRSALPIAAAPASAPTNADTKTSAAAGNADASSEAATDGWEALGIGATVLAYDAPNACWFESIVIGVAPDDPNALRLRWRDYPDEPAFRLHRGRVALIGPGAA